ncbi:LLM class flavin-dependent oxidoreductase [Pseudarthrobacter sp. S9]|uniref:LLM class flavin-dependent oxidoreductase n=1 Tax=Pseudarthrobacter sp. S9 TaxID=3418421 RepID=UPI003CFF0A25
MRYSIFHALGAPGDLANYGTHMKNTREYAQAAEEYGFWSVWYTNQPAPAGTK